LIGFFVIPYVADNWGRKIGIQISWGFFIIGLVFYAVADSSHMIGMGQLMVGFGCNPAITLCYSFLN
jgi:MFS family permease